MKAQHIIIAGALGVVGYLWWSGQRRTTAPRAGGAGDAVDPGATSLGASLDQLIGGGKGALAGINGLLEGLGIKDRGGGTGESGKPADRTDPFFGDRDSEAGSSVSSKRLAGTATPTARQTWVELASAGIYD